MGGARPGALVRLVVIGIVNGVVTTRFKIPSFIATLGMMFLLRGFIRWVAGAGKGSDAVQQFLYPGETFEAILTGRTFGPIHAQALWLIAFAIVIYVIMNRHRFGNHVFAVGGNRDAAIATGINANRVKIIAFIICSVLAATAGIFSATRINATIPRQTLLGLELQAIASCVIGGLFLFGGLGDGAGDGVGRGLDRHHRQRLRVGPLSRHVLQVLRWRDHRARRHPQRLGR